MPQLTVRLSKDDLARLDLIRRYAAMGKEGKLIVNNSDCIRLALRIAAFRVGPELQRIQSHSIRGMFDGKAEPVN